MKSLIVLLALIGFYNTTQAQNSPSQNVAENKPAKVTETSINGIPYSQYKAQQEALKNKQQAAKPEPIMHGVTLGSSEDMKALNAPQKPVTSNAPVVAKPVVAKPVDVNGTSLQVKPVEKNIKPYIEAVPSSVTPAATPKVLQSKQGGN